MPVERSDRKQIERGDRNADEAENGEDRVEAVERRGANNLHIRDERNGDDQLRNDAAPRDQRVIELGCRNGVATECVPRPDLN